ncbi:MAG TPA: hypothetical protein DCK99_21870 [Blastocatellia bacterium]|nr:hypothetical protein [Blastocatellia bacterium]
MSSVNEQQAGVASGINNAVSRAASLLAIAVLGVVMLQIFSRELQRRLGDMDIPEATRAQLFQQRIKVAGLEIPGNLDSTEQELVAQAVKESFVSGFRVVMFIAAAMALAGALTTGLIIEHKKQRAS